MHNPYIRVGHTRCIAAGGGKCEKKFRNLEDWRLTKSSNSSALVVGNYKKNKFQTALKLWLRTEMSILSIVILSLINVKDNSQKMYTFSENVYPRICIHGVSKTTITQSKVSNAEKKQVLFFFLFSLFLLFFCSLLSIMLWWM